MYQMIGNVICFT